MRMIPTLLLASSQNSVTIGCKYAGPSTIGSPATQDTSQFLKRSNLFSVGHEKAHLFEKDPINFKAVIFNASTYSIIALPVSTSSTHSLVRWTLLCCHYCTHWPFTQVHSTASIFDIMCVDFLFYSVTVNCSVIVMINV